MERSLRRLFSSSRVPGLLGEPSLYLQEIERLQARVIEKPAIQHRKQRGVPLASIFLKRRKFSKLLAKQVAAGDYHFEPVEEHEIWSNDKKRIIHELTVSDRIVAGVLAELITPALDEALSPQVFSYRKGKNWWHAVSYFADFTAAHCRLRENPKDRGLYVMRQDVSEYTESIPTHVNSPLWGLVREVTENTCNSRQDSERLFDTIKTALRVPVFSEDTATHSRLTGIATGSPLSTQVANLYLVAIDTLGSAVDGGCYLRYGDDILFAHEDPTTVMQLTKEFDRTLNSLQLSFNEEKRRFLYFNGSGRSSDACESAKGTTVVDFLGCRLGFDGTVSLQPKEYRRVLRDCKNLIHSVWKSMNASDPEERAQEVTAAINRSFDLSSAQAHPSTSMILRCVTDRNQLKQLDYEIALSIAEKLAGTSGPKAFRTHPYRMLRSKHGLQSLVRMRNQWQKYNE